MRLLVNGAYFGSKNRHPNFYCIHYFIILVTIVIFSISLVESGPTDSTQNDDGKPETMNNEQPILLGKSRQRRWCWSCIWLPWNRRDNRPTPSGTTSTTPPTVTTTPTKSNTTMRTSVATSSKAVNSTEKISTINTTSMNYPNGSQHDMNNTTLPTNDTRSDKRKNDQSSSESNLEKFIRCLKKYLKKYVILLLVVVVGLIMAMTAMISIICYKRCKSNRKKTVLFARKIKNVIIKWEYSTYGNFTEPRKVPVVKIEIQKDVEFKCDPLVEYVIPTDSEWEFPRQNIEFISTLGVGRFAEVKLAKALETHQVAVKMLKTSHTNNDLINLVQEMEIMKAVGKHKNVLEFVGCCSQNGPLYVITAYAPYGNLLGLLRNHGDEYAYPHDLRVENQRTLKLSVSDKDLISFAHQIAQGMEYIESKKFIHGDLAACNILVSDHYVMKIADFGVIRDFAKNEYYRGSSDGRHPVKWMAPEVFLFKKYSIQSDVWSFGILLWEIMSLGETPYPLNTEIEPLLRLILNGFRMKKPMYCSAKVYQIMKQCWANQAESRPIFSQLVTELDKLLAKAKTTKHKPVVEENIMVNNGLYACVDVTTTPRSLDFDENM